MKKNKILIGICGSISAFKSLSIISSLISRGFDVKVIMTEAASKFVTRESVAVISKNNLYEEDYSKIYHIELAEWCDIFAIVPATYNTIAKLANGICDNLLTQTFSAITEQKRVLIFPTMNSDMYNNCSIKYFKSFSENSEIIEADSGKLACGKFGIGKMKKTSDITDIIEFYSIQMQLGYKWTSPIPYNKFKGTTIDSFSFLKLKEIEFELPLYPHCGAFGAYRKYDRHKGIDLYCPEGTYVYPVEDGIIIDICPFTGKEAGCDWWLDTKAVYIKGKSGITVYGEIEVSKDLKIGDKISSKYFNRSVGTVKRVLKTDKGRPLSMLHLELHDSESIHTETWKTDKPSGLLDPTLFLKESLKFNKIS